MKPVLAIPLFALLLADCAPATPEDRAALVGVWSPEDGSGRLIEFRDNGEFDFLYDPDPPTTVLRVHWQLKRKGSVDILEHDGSLYKSCPYRIEETVLVIDGGDGGECLPSAAAPAVRMAKRFSRMP